MNKVFFVVFLVLSMLFLVRYFIIGQAVYGDGLFYWSYTHSIYFDQDLDLSNQMNHTFSPLSNNSSSLPKPFTDNRYIEYRYPPVASLFWLPAFTIADIVASNVNSQGNIRNGFSDIYQISVGIFNISLIVLGLKFAYEALKYFFDENISIISVVILTFSTNLFYYSNLDVINSHPTSFFISSLFILLFIKATKQQKYYYLTILGFFAGLLGATRTQDVLFLILVISLIFIGYNKRFLLSSVEIARYIKLIFFSMTGFIIGFFPQMIFWKLTYGSFIHRPYDATPGYFIFFAPKLIELITNYKTGILFFSPILILSFVGLIIFFKKERILGSIFILFILLQYYLIASWNAWHQGASYGNRMLISTYPLLVFGLALIIKHLQERVGKRGIFLMSVTFVLLNFSMIFYFQLFLQGDSYIEGQNTQQILLKKFDYLLKDYSIR